MFSPAQERNCSSKLKKKMKKPKRMKKTGKMERQPMVGATTRGQHSKRVELAASKKKRIVDAVDLHLF
jgi:hypothetical protein